MHTTVGQPGCIVNQSPASAGGRGSTRRRKLTPEAFRRDVVESETYYQLARTLASAASTVELRDGRVLSRQQLYLETIRADTTNFRAYLNLAVGLQENKTVTLHDGRELTQQQLCVEALRQNPSYGCAYYNLSRTLRRGESITLPDGRLMTEQQLLLEAISHDGADSQRCNNLGATMRHGDTVTLPDGRTLTRKQLYVEALRLDPANDDAFRNALRHLDVRGDNARAEGLAPPAKQHRRDEIR
jgi:hypothetical protein